MKVIRYILLTLNILAAVALLLTTLAGSIAPSRSVLPSVAAYAYLPLLGLNVLFALGWVAARKWPFLLSVAAIAARWSFVGLYLQVGGTSTPPPADQHPQRVTLLSYNLHNFSGPDFEYAPADTFARAFVDLVRSESPDLLCLQEYTPPKGYSLTDTLTLMGYNHYYGSAGKADRPLGTVIFSRLPITYVKRIDRIKVLAEVLVGERPLRICCVHMDSYQFTATDREEIDRLRHGHVDSTSHYTFRKAKQTVVSHEAEWDQLLRPIVEGCSVPLVVAGDMNDIPGSWLYARLADHLADTYRDCGSGIGLTYLGSFPQFRIDMVFRNDQLRTLSYRRLRTRLSDHYPLLVSLEPVAP